MFILDLTNPITLLLVIFAAIFLFFLAKEIKVGSIALIPVFSFIGLLIFYVLQLHELSEEYINLANKIYISIAIDFVFIILSVITFLCINNLEANKGKIKGLERRIK